MIIVFGDEPNLTEYDGPIFKKLIIQIKEYTEFDRKNLQTFNKLKLNHNINDSDLRHIIRIKVSNNKM